MFPGVERRPLATCHASGMRRIEMNPDLYDELTTLYDEVTTHVNGSPSGPPSMP